MAEQRKTAIITDSSCDLSDEQLAEHGIHMIPLRIVCQKAEYRDRVDLTQEALYEILKTELPKTSLPLPEDVSSLYDQLLEEGITDVVHVCISSGLSGAMSTERPKPGSRSQTAVSPRTNDAIIVRASSGWAGGR